MPSDALDFLRLILPSEGLKCAAIFKNGPKRPPVHKFTASFQELADIILLEDALGHTVYHACASYKTSDNRKASNVLAVKALWADVDFGAEHHAKPSKYGDAQEAAEAVVQCCRKASLPLPVFVSSGHGLHTYWPLCEVMGSELWRHYAVALRQVLDREGLEVDGARATDCASILRTPGTRNRKGVETLVRWGGGVGPYRLEELGALNAVEISNGLVPEVRRVQRRAPVDVPVPSSRRLIDSALTLYGEQPNYAEPIAAQCGQLAELRALRGVVPEPQWYAALGVLAHCADGDAFAHLWSSGYAGYTEQETSARLERARGFGPTTCEKFAGVNARGCEGCPLRGTITSPIQLGRRSVAAPQEDRSPKLQNSPAQSTDNEIEHAALPKLPGDFRWHGRSLAFVTETSDGEDAYEVVSTYPLYLKGVQTGEINGEAFSLRFGLELPNEAPKEIVLGARTVFSSTGISEISGKGAVIHDTDLFKKYVREAVDMFNAEHRLDKRYEQYGWKDDDASFLFGANVYVAGEAHAVPGADEVKIRNQWLGPMKGGEIGKWSRAANALFTKGCEPQSFALLGSFAAPLMRFHSSGEGGSIISLVNDQSGSGKTTALEAVESVWGRKEAIRLTDDDTRVSKSLILGVLANLPVTWDELYNRDPEKIREFVLMFTNGRDKMRGTQDGGLRHNKAAWQTILMLASNNSITEILSSAGGSDAPAFRVMEFHTEIPKGIAAKGDELKRLLRDNSGLAGDAYMRLLTQPQVLNYVKTALPTITDQVWQKTQLNNEHRFWVRTIAAVAAASIVINKLGILEFSNDRITDWAIESVKEMAGIAKAAKRDPLDMFAQFLAANLLNTLVVPTAWKPRTDLRALIEPRRELHIRYERDTQRIYINEFFLRKWLTENGVLIREFTRKMKDMGVLLRDGKRITLGAGTDYASSQAVCYEIDGAHPLVKGGVRVVEEALPTETPRTKRVEKYLQEIK